MLRSIFLAFVFAGAVLAAPPVLAHEYPTRFFTLIHPWAEATEAGAREAPVYFQLESVEAADRLMGAWTPFAERVEIRQADAAVPLAAASFEPAERVDFGADRPHLVLLGLKEPLQWGRSYLMTMEFEKAGKILVMVSVGAH